MLVIDSTYPTPISTRVRVKICGLTHPQHALHAAKEGADMLGLVFASSRRQVTIEEAHTIANALRIAYGSHPQVVGVFVNETASEMLRVARVVGLDALQMSGDEAPYVVAECARYYPVLKALRFQASISFEEATRTLALYRQVADPSRLRFLIDAHHPAEYGGTGTKADWSLAARLARHEEIVLAGGLTPSNVSKTLRDVQPWAVDVSSGVEREGMKHMGLIEEFIRKTFTTHLEL